MRIKSREALAALGFTSEDERLYWNLLGLSGSSVSAVAHALGVDPDELLLDIEPLVRARVISLVDDTITARSPGESLALLVRSQAERAERLTRRLDAIAASIPVLAAGARPLEGGAQAIDGEVLGQTPVLELLEGWVRSSHGELLWLRPDQWRLESDAAMTAAVRSAVASGRRSRALYPATAMQLAPEALRSRAEAGEQMRLLAEIPLRLAIVGDQALVQGFQGVGSHQKIVLRQPALMVMARTVFEAMWARASPVPDFDLGHARDDVRRLLLEQLAAGAKDEQIARALGLSLRTVRRRAAALMTELGVDSRFQAGVEAARRGWV